MKIRIIDVKADASVVSFHTGLGDAVAVWNGAIPKPDTIYHVEVEVQDTLIWDENIEQVRENKPALGIDAGEFCLVGRLESAEADGYSVIRIGENIVAVTVRGTPPPLGVFVKLRSRNVALYDLNY
jgi:hypothetical protein